MDTQCLCGPLILHDFVNVECTGSVKVSTRTKYLMREALSSDVHIPPMI